MKNAIPLNACVLSILTLALLVSCSARPERFAQPDDSQKELTDAAVSEKEPEVQVQPLVPPEFIDGAPEQEILGSMGTTQAFRVGDLTVLHKATPSNSVVTTRLYFDGGVTNLKSENAGIEKLALSVATRGGTEEIPKDAFHASLDSIGASVWSFVDRDYSGYALKTTVEHFDTTWELFEQSILTPRMPLAEIELRRERQLSEIRSLLEDPDDHVSHIATRKLFKDHPYLPLHVGTEKNVRSFTRDQLGAYQRSLLDPGRMLLVVVGNVSPGDVLDKVSANLGRLKSSREASEAPLPEFTSEPGVELANRALPTHYVLGYFAAPAPGHPDYPAMVVATEYLRDKLFEEVRTRRNLTYAVSAGLANKRRNYGYLYVTATDPQTTMGVIYNTVEEMKLLQIPRVELDQVVNVSLTEYFMSLETHGGQATALANAHLVGNDWKLAEVFLPEIRSVTPEDVRKVVRRYLKDFRVGVVGDEASVEPAYFQPLSDGRGFCDGLLYTPRG